MVILGKMPTFCPWNFPYSCQLSAFSVSSPLLFM